MTDNSCLTGVWYARDIKGSVRNTVQLSASGALQSSNHVFTYPSGLPVRVGGAWRTARLHQGKEWIEADGTGWYDNAARLYDAILIRFLTPDPLWHDFGTTTPYNYCLANPMRFLDRDGKRPTAYEAALMCLLSYEDNLSNDNLPAELNGWRLSNFETSIQMNYTGRTENGLQSVLFQRKNCSCDIEYAYVFAGTNSARDAVEDMLQLVGKSNQYEAAVSNAITLSSEIGGSELTYLGHSLGGGEAGAASLATGRDAITFNAAALSEKTKQKYYFFSTGKVINYRIAPISGKGITTYGGDILSDLQVGVGMNALGIDKPLKYNIRNTIEAHRIVNFIEYFSTHPEP